MRRGVMNPPTSAALGVEAGNPIAATPQPPPALGVDRAQVGEGEQAARPLRLPTERPILFSAPMVRAILDGRKTQTRRVVKRAALEAIEFCTGRADDTPAVTSDLGVFYDHPEVEDSLGRTRRLKYPEWLFYCAEYPGEGSVPVGQGHGAVGDRLWVRETWRGREPDQDCYLLEFRADRPEYKTRDDDPCSVPWRPSIYMPRWASRITLEVTCVRVERLHEITSKDAEAEGVERCIVGEGWRNYDVTPAQEEVGAYPMRTAGDSFLTLWRSINGADSYAANPWVWVVEFKRVTS